MFAVYRFDFGERLTQASPLLTADPSTPKITSSHHRSRRQVNTQLKQTICMGVLCTFSTLTNAFSLLEGMGWHCCLTLVLAIESVRLIHEEFSFHLRLSTRSHHGDDVNITEVLSLFLAYTQNRNAATIATSQNPLGVGRARYKRPRS